MFEVDRFFELALRSVIGWAIAVLLTTYIGIWLGVCLAFMHIISPLDETLLNILCALPVAWLIVPQLTLGIAASILAFVLPLWFDARQRWALLGILLTWILVIIWVVRSGGRW